LEYFILYTPMQWFWQTQIMFFEQNQMKYTHTYNAID